MSSRHACGRAVRIACKGGGDTAQAAQEQEADRGEGAASAAADGRAGLPEMFAR